MIAIDKLLTRIAREHLGFRTLRTRSSDGLDFREVSVWCVAAALREAYTCGQRNAGKPTTGQPLHGSGVPATFDDYEIHGIRRGNLIQGCEEELQGLLLGANCEQVDDAEAEFWSLFGHIPGQGLDCIGDFATRQHAEEIYARITGRPYPYPARNANAINPIAISGTGAKNGENKEAS